MAQRLNPIYTGGEDFCVGNGTFKTVDWLTEIEKRKQKGRTHVLGDPF